MNRLILDLQTYHGPIYLRLVKALQDAIRQGHVAPGEKLPPSRSLAEQLQINRHTVMRGYAELCAQGWVESLERSSYRATRSLPIEHSRSQTPTASAPPIFQWQPIKATNDSSSFSSFIEPYPNLRYNFAGGRPDLSLFPFSEYRSALGDALKRPKLAHLHYGNNRGEPELLEQANVYLRRSRSLQTKEIMVVNGSQEALFLIAQLLLSPTDNVAVEHLGYPPAWQAFHASGANLLGVEQDELGICPRSLASLARRHKLKCLYLTPLHQYPSTVTLSLSRRRQIYRLAQQYGFFIIEDDYDHEFHYQSQPLAPMAADDPAQLVIYLASFSKVMYPAARCGLLAAPESLIDALVALRTCINHKPAQILQDALARWMQSGGLERHIRRCTKQYHQRLNNALEQLSQAQQQGVKLNYQVPQGGMALWIHCSIDTAELARRLLSQEVFIQHGAQFSLHAHKSADNYIRLGFAGLNCSDFNQGFTLICHQIRLMQLNID